MNKKGAHIRLFCVPEFVPVLISVGFVPLFSFIGFSFSCVKVFSIFCVGFKKIVSVFSCVDT